jgi:hypothetical protein
MSDKAGDAVSVSPENGQFSADGNAASMRTHDLQHIDGMLVFVPEATCTLSSARRTGAI